MPAPDFVPPLLGWRVSRSGRRVPNIADSGSTTSVAVASKMLEMLNVTRTTTADEDESGTALEEGVKACLASELPARDPSRQWQVDRRKHIRDFVQYAHLQRLDEVVKREATLRVEIGRDYMIKPDVTVGVPLPRSEGDLILHAAISCKWTLRSDRAQNVRHEAIMLTRHRRGRQPHIVAVTLEPLATRLAALGRGTGEVDAVYHAAFEELRDATTTVGTVTQQEMLDELTGQGRVLDFATLVDALLV